MSESKTTLEFFNKDFLKSLAEEEIKRTHMTLESKPRAKTIGIMAAMEVEATLLYDFFKGNAKSEEVVEVQGRRFFVFELEDEEVILTVCGIGTNNASVSATLLCERFEVDLLIHTGIAGALSKDLKHFDYVLAKEISFDRTKGLGYVVSYPFKDSYTGTTRYALSKDYRERFKEAFDEEEKLHEGLILTSDVFVDDKKVKEEMLAAYPDALACEMEGAATAQVAYSYGIDCLIFRCISDMAEASMENSFEYFEEKASHISAKALQKFFAK